MARPNITREQFLAKAPKVTVRISIDGVEGEGYVLTASPSEFSTGSLGWNLTGKLPMVVDGEQPECQLGMNLTVIGSKLLPPVAKPEPAPKAKAK